MSDLNNALHSLIEKYNLPDGEIINANNVPQLRTSNGEFTLLPWRVERRFVELKNLIQNNTLENVSTLRFASIKAGGDLSQQIARELDLVIWMVDSSVASLFAVCSSNIAANLIVKLANDVSVSIECSNKLPENAKPIDRHEIIARRGVASDRVVDTQVPQSSIYAFTDQGDAQYTDTDSELFGLAENEIHIVRAAFALLKKPTLGPIWNQAAKQIQTLIEAVKQSNATASVIKLQGGQLS